jgi:hypothetical protein
MVDRKVVPFDEFYYQLKLMYLFLLHPVCINNFFIVFVISLTTKLEICYLQYNYLFTSFMVTIPLSVLSVSLLTY